MTDVWVVRAEFGKYTDNFVAGGYVGAGWINDKDLSAVKDKDELYPMYQRVNPHETSKNTVGANVGMLALFLLQIKADDYVITPAAETEWLHYGKVAEDPSYYHSDVGDGCPFRHRRKAAWEGPLRRSELSVQFKHTLQAAKTVFYVSHRDEFLRRINEIPELPPPPRSDPYRVVLNQILNLDAKKFEYLIGELLTALGFEGVEVTGKPGDGGVDAVGELNISDVVKVKVFTQAKRYKNHKVKASEVKKLRQ